LIVGEHEAAGHVLGVRGIVRDDELRRFRGMGDGRHLVDDEPRCRRIFPHQHALLAPHATGQPGAEDLVRDGGLDQYQRPRVVRRLEKPVDDPRRPCAQSRGLVFVLAPAAEAAGTHDLLSS
jgi:hypothetical protein